MAGIFKATDILLAAQEIETRGEVFYNRLVDTTTEPKLKGHVCLSGQGRDQAQGNLPQAL